jgi:hypothetical protein
MTSISDRKKQIAAWCAFQSDETLKAVIAKFREMIPCVEQTEFFILAAAENEWRDRKFLSNWKELVKEFEVDTLQSADDVDKEISVYVFSKMEKDDE